MRNESDARVDTAGETLLKQCIGSVSVLRSPGARTEPGGGGAVVLYDSITWGQKVSHGNGMAWLLHELFCAGKGCMTDARFRFCRQRPIARTPSRGCCFGRPHRQGYSTVGAEVGELCIGTGAGTGGPNINVLE